MRGWAVFLLLISWQIAGQECIPTVSSVELSPRLANYKMNVKLDRQAKKASGTSIITWHNNSPVSVSTIRMYMYLNAFKNNQSSYLRDGSRRMPAGDLVNRDEIEWGYIEVSHVRQGSLLDVLEQHYIRPNDGNPNDQTVLEILLEESVEPGDSVHIYLDFVSKLPRTISRVGYAEHDFFHFVHWYPKLGVFEKDVAGNYNWNCHQYLPQMEFYGDHGNYEVTIELDPDFTIGGSGCMVLLDEDESRALYRFTAEDMIDFAWCASPHLKVYKDHWNHVDIRHLYPASHEGLVRRLVDAAKHGLDYLTEHVGDYPYRTLTILDPPVYGLRSGFMEYPTYITGGAFHCWPRSIRTIESLVIHEFVHQYFMQMLASNEKESPWLDEGFATFYEDCIMESAFGQEASLANPLGYAVSNSAFTRNEYASLDHPNSDAIDTKSWEIMGDYKGIIYSKTATFLQTIKAHLGERDFRKMMRTYFENNKFSHPTRSDFEKELRNAFTHSDSYLGDVIDTFLIQSLDQTAVCDYEVASIDNWPRSSLSGVIADDIKENYKKAQKIDGFESEVGIVRRGDFIIPVEIEFVWEDGKRRRIVWNGSERMKVFQFQEPNKLISAQIDPDYKVPLDIDYNNNSITLRPQKKSLWKYAVRSIYWAQNVLQSSNFLM